MLVLSRLGLVNNLLAAFPPSVLLQLEEHLQSVELSAGQVLYEGGETLRHAYFPSTAVVSLFSSLPEGVGTEVAVVGREGIVGVGTFMGANTSISSAVVLRPGHAMRLSAQRMEELVTNPQVISHLLRYTQVLLGSMAQTAACHSHHSLYHQLCRWLLLHLDCQKENDMYITHERIAGMLGVRRESITESALKLQREGMIQYQRGLFKVIDRQKLEHEACECYSVIKGFLETLRQHQCTAHSEMPIRE